MATLDFFRSHNIPSEISDRIFLLAGLTALANFRCTSHANAEAHKDVAHDFVRRCQWVFNASSPTAVQIARLHRLPCIRITHVLAHNLPFVTAFEWLRELYIDDTRSNDNTNESDARDPASQPYLDAAISMLPQQLVVFVCGNCRLTEMPVLPPSLTRLVWTDIYSDSERRLATPLPSSLRSLRVNVRAASLPDLLPPSLEYLNVNRTRQRSGTLPQLPLTLKHLSCKGAGLTHLPDLPPGLLSLRCSSNRISALPSLPATLEHLHCFANRLVSLPAPLPGRLQTLNCSANKLFSLPDLPPSVETLHCFNQQAGMGQLPELPSGLRILGCSGNKLDLLPKLPPALHYLNCSMNRLPSLPELPDRLNRLDCACNRIAQLPCLPADLQHLRSDIGVYRGRDRSWTLLSCTVNTSVDGGFETIQFGP